MTQRSAREARIHLISEGVIASYIQDISTRTLPPQQHPLEREREPALVDEQLAAA